MAKGRIRLGRVVIPADNTPDKAPGDTLVPTPVWEYKGPACTIEIRYQVGRWGIGFAGDTGIVIEEFEQQASDDWGTFSTVLQGVALTGLNPATGDIYDMEMWFISDAFDDEAAIFTGCCHVAAAVADLNIVSCSFA